MSTPEPTVSERIKTAIDQISKCDSFADAPIAVQAVRTLEDALKQIQFARAEAQAQIDRF